MKHIVLSAFAVVLLVIGATATPAPAQAATISTISLIGPGVFVNAHPNDSKGAEALSPYTLKFFHKFAEFNNTFVDKYKFSINDIEKLDFNITTKNHVLGMTFRLYDDQGNQLFSLSDFATNAGETKLTQLSFTGALLDAMLASSFLTLKITGAMCSCASYSITAVTPIPAALLMFMTALGGMGTLAWRRNKHQAAAA